jgi:hypothetical protein
MSPESSASESADLIRFFRQNYTNLYRQRARAGAAVVRTPQEDPIRAEGLPAGLRARLQAYREAHPGETIELLKYMRVTGGRPEKVVEDERDLPGEDQLLVISQTVTLNTKEEVDVVTDILVARRA